MNVEQCTRDPESLLRGAYAEALASLDVAARTREALGPPPRAGRVVLVALGKCAAPMVAGAAERWAERISRVVVARPARSAPVDPAVRTMLERAGAHFDEFSSGHPLPDELSERAGRAALEALAALRREDTALVLLSGGASAAACVPRPGITLEDLREASRTLLAAGLPVEVINAARGELDEVKHGGLSRVAAGARVLTLATADILGDENAVKRALGSAPTLEQPPERALLDAARAALPARLRRALDVRTARKSSGTRGMREYVLIASPAQAREALARAIERAGFAVAPMPDVTEDVAIVAAHYARAASALAPGEAHVAVGEPTVRLPRAPGRGGRAGRLALLVARAIEGKMGVGFLAAATDGVDGESGYAGAVVTGATTARARAAGVDPDAALARFDDAVAHQAAGSAIDTGPTGLNLLDLYALVRVC